MVDLLLAAFRRAGYEVALSQGMRPKPVISLALARGVGIASEDEHCTIELVGEGHDPAVLLDRLAATCPRGVVPLEARPAGPKAVAVGAAYRIELEAPDDIVARAVDAYRASAELPIERRSPKQRRTVDVKRFAPEPRLEGGAILVDIAILEDGSAKPEEVARALAACAGTDLPVQAITRLSVAMAPKPARIATTETA